METKDVLAKLRQAREEARLTRKELAAKLSVSQQTIYNYETGDREIGIPTLLLWAEACDIDPAWMFLEDSGPGLSHLLEQTRLGIVDAALKLMDLAKRMEPYNEDPYNLLDSENVDHDDV